MLTIKKNKKVSKHAQMKQGQRKMPRVLARIPIAYRKDVSSHWYRGWLSDISLEGARIEDEKGVFFFGHVGSVKRLRKGDAVEIELQVSKTSSPLILKASVVWSRHQIKAACCGLQLIIDEPQKKEGLRSLLSFIVDQYGGEFDHEKSIYQDRRGGMRISVRLPLSYRVSNKDPWRRTWINNISYDGISFENKDTLFYFDDKEVKRACRVGDELEVKYQLSGMEVPAQALCKIVWIGAGVGGTRYGASLVPVERSIRENMAEYFRRAILKNHGDLSGATEMGEEPRKKTRLYVEIPMRYRQPGRSQWCRGWISDISSDGLAFKADQVIGMKSGDEFELEYQLSTVTPAVHAKGVVVWVTQSRGVTKCGAKLCNDKEINDLKAAD